MKLLSIQVGKPRDVQWQGKTVSTGIFKHSVPGPITVRTLNLDGDSQADLSVHGGRDKAVYGYGLDAYPWWQKRLPSVSFANGAFGENLTFETLTERDFCVDDIYALGTAQLQVVQPRFPCHKLGIKFQDMSILKTFMESGRPGIYFRVVQEGIIQPGDELKLVSASAGKASVMWIFDLRVKAPISADQKTRMLRTQGLPKEFRELFERL